MFPLIYRVLIRRAPRLTCCITEFKTPSINYCQRAATALRSKKSKSTRSESKYFIDLKHVRVVGGNGGDGCISFLRLWCNENAGPDGGDGGNGGHIVFQASSDVTNLNHLNAINKADGGVKGSSDDCHGKNANHTIIKVPIGTIVRNQAGKIVGDLDEDNLMFVAARGGAGGKGNHFFATNLNQAPQISEFGGPGEDLSYTLELRSMAHIGLIGLPNAGKSTILRAITRARPKVAAYPFTTLKPHLGMVPFDDFSQVSVADLPGLIPGSHLNKGLGIQFLKHVERCAALLFVVDISADDSSQHYHNLMFELEKFSPELAGRPHIIVANKIDLPEAEERLQELKDSTNVPVLAISAKVGANVSGLLGEIRRLYDNHCSSDVKRT